MDKLNKAIEYKNHVEETLAIMEAKGQAVVSNAKFREMQVQLHLVKQLIQKIETKAMPFVKRENHEELLTELEARCRAHDWYFEAANGEQYYNGCREHDIIVALVTLTGDEGKAVFQKHYKSIQM